MCRQGFASLDVIVVARSVLLLCAGMRDIYVAILPQRDTCHSRICRVVKVAAIPNASHHPTKGSCPLSCIFVSIAIVACRVGVACFVFFFFALKQKPNHKHYCSMNTDNFPFHLYIYMHCICFAWLETYTKNGVVRIKLMWLCKALDWIRGWMLWQNNTHNQYFSCFCIQKQMETSTTYAKTHKAFIFYTIHNAHDFSSIYSDAICRRNYTFYASTELV